MKINYLIITLIFSILISTSIATLATNKIALKKNDAINLILTKSSYYELQMTNSLSALHFININTGKGDFARLYINGYTKNLETGNPLLPVKREMIEIPAGATPVVKIISYSTREIDLSEYGITKRLYPSQPEQRKNDYNPEFKYNPEAYTVNTYGDKELITVDILGYLRGTRVGRINIAPVKYNPVTNKLLIYNDLVFEIVFENADIKRTTDLKKRYYSPFFSALNHQLINYTPISLRDNFMRYPIKYVIVSDPMFEDQLQPFIEWKTKMGYTIVEAYTDDPEVGSTKQEIRDYLKNLYNEGTPENPAPSFILFAGDVAQIPAWDGNTDSHVTDLFYCEYTDDYFPEVYYGRFSAQDSADLQPQIDKTLQYEKYTMPDPTYLNEVVMVAGIDGNHGYDWANGQINYGTINYFNSDHDLTSHTYLYPESGYHSDDIIEDISNGVTYANYTAHCSPSGWGNPAFTVNDIPTLKNKDEYGLLVGNCCLSNTFNNDECFGEALLRAEDKGALGYIGGSNNTEWDPDYYWAVGVGEINENPPSYSETTLGAYDRTFHDHGEPFEDWYISQDEMIYAGNLAVTEGSPNSAEYYWEIYCLMGDPSLKIYFSEPPALTVEYADEILIGISEFTVTTEPYAYVGLSVDGVLHGAALANSAGVAELEIEPFTEPGTADIVVTKQNYQPHIGTVKVIPPDGPYIRFQSYSINDENGNNNDSADYGEDISLDVYLENIGNDSALNVNATITSSDSLITINKENGEWGTIPPYDSSLKEKAFELTINDSIPDQHLVLFNMVIEGDTTRESWEDVFVMTINGPILASGNLIIDDSISGNGNGSLDPGENCNLVIPSLNNGHADIDDVVAKLTCSDTNISIINEIVELDTLYYEESKNAVFELTLSDSLEVETSVDFYYTLESAPYVYETKYSIITGLLTEDFETGDFSKFDWQFSGDANWQICDNNPYEGLYCAQSGDIGDEQFTEMSITYESSVDDSISFFKKVSCEDDIWNDDYDYLAFFIDDVEMGRWDGTVSWSRESYPVSADIHTYKWVYSKDYSIAAGQDCAWVDYIIFPPKPNYVNIKENRIKNDEISFKIFPNPTSGNTNIRLILSNSDEIINFTIYNATGQAIKQLIKNKKYSKGIYHLSFETETMQDGIYFCILQTKNNKIIKKLIKTK